MPRGHSATGMSQLSVLSRSPFGAAVPSSYVPVELAIPKLSMLGVARTGSDSGRLAAFTLGQGLDVSARAARPPRAHISGRVAVFGRPALAWTTWTTL